MFSPPGLIRDPDDGPKALARRIDTLLSDPDLRRQDGDAGRAHMSTGHLRPAATDTLRRALLPIVKGLA